MTAYNVSERTTVVEDGLARRIEVYQNRELFGSWLGTYLKQHQIVESAIWEVINERLLNNAVGVQLTILGKIVGEKRWTDDDNEFRISVGARVAINISHGRDSDVREVARLVLLTTAGIASFHFEEHYPATLFIVLDETIHNDPNRAVSYLQQARAAGVRLQLLYLTAPADETFTFAAGTAVEVSSTQGFGHGAAFPPTQGGLFASVAV